MPSVSVVVPVYNVAEYLKRCLDSLSYQTEKDIEIICIDDGSTDGSGEIAEACAKKDKRIKVIHQENKGLSGARNTGLAAAKGEFISFCDSDDYLHPQFFEKFLPVIRQTGADAVCGQIVKTSRKYPIKFSPLQSRLLKMKVIDNPIEVFLKKSLLATGVCRYLYRRSSIGDLRFLDGIYFEDVPFMTLFMQQIKRVAVTNYPVHYYFNNPHSIMRTSFNETKVRSYVKLIRFIDAYEKQKNPALLASVRQYVLNRRFKMMLNQAVRKQKNIGKRKQLFDLIQRETQMLYHEGIISYAGLKIHHRVALWLLLHAKTSTPARLWMSVV